MSEDSIKILAVNRKAYHNYSVEESLECGLELQGTEVKSIKANQMSFPDAFATIDSGEVFLRNFHINEYIYSSIFNHDPDRKKKLLLHKHEIKRLMRKVDEKGYTLVPLKFYLKKGRVKVELGICKGKKLYDKREALKDRDNKLDLAREFKDKNN